MQWKRKRGRFVIKPRYEPRSSEPTQVQTRPDSRRNFGALTAKLALSTSGVMVAAMSMIGVGAWSTFNSTTTVSQTDATGTVTVALGTGGTSANRLSIGATGLAPTDTIQRAVDIVNSGTINFASDVLTTSATSSTALDTDATNGLQMNIDECSVAWTESGPPYTYTCSGSTTATLASRAVIGSSLSMGSTTLTAGNTGHYRITLTLPSTAPTSMQNLSSTIQYSWTATQRAGTNK